MVSIQHSLPHYDELVCLCTHDLGAPFGSQGHGGDPDGPCLRCGCPAFREDFHHAGEGDRPRKRRLLAGAVGHSGETDLSERIEQLYTVKYPEE